MPLKQTDAGNTGNADLGTQGNRFRRDASQGKGGNLEPGRRVPQAFEAEGFPAVGFGQRAEHRANECVVRVFRLCAEQLLPAVTGDADDEARGQDGAQCGRGNTAAGQVYAVQAARQCNYHTIKAQHALTIGI